MNPTEKGRMIAKLRKEAGYTQKTLAEALFVTDKAVSKWERGLCMPDSSLLTKLSVLLETDIEYLLSGAKLYGEHENPRDHWQGEIRVEHLKGTVAGRPIVQYLLSYFLLVGITDVYIRTKDTAYIAALHLEQYGLHISFFPKTENRKTMIVHDKFLLFGTGLTRQFQYCMAQAQNVVPTLGDAALPLVFTHHPAVGLTESCMHADRKNFGRGMVYIPLQNEQQIRDAEQFIHIYETYNHCKIADLAEICRLRKIDCPQ